VRLSDTPQGPFARSGAIRRAAASMLSSCSQRLRSAGRTWRSRCAFRSVPRGLRQVLCAFPLHLSPTQICGEAS
jgi:hypothetical protein